LTFKLTRRACLALPFMATPWTARSAEWPARPVRLIVPAPPGGSTDITARLLQEPLQRMLGQPIVVENRPGASGVVATDSLVRSAPDGYTLLLAYSSHASNPALVPKLGYDSLKDVTPIAFYWRQQMAVAVNPSLPARSLKELIALAKARPGDLGYATYGIGSAAHFLGAQLERAAGIRLSHVPYRGTGPAINDALGGQVPIVITNVGSLVPHERTGKLVLIGVSGDTRSPIAPVVPSAGEAGFAGVNASEWLVLLGPRGLASTIVSRLNRTVAEAVAVPEVAERFRSFGMVHTPMSPAEVASFLEGEIRSLGAIIQAAGITAE
jgi:tripartite-type tricarboxylate transporter receptor subunit TctC